MRFKRCNRHQSPTIIRFPRLVATVIACLLPITAALAQENYGDWSDSGRVYINTGNTGAGISQPVLKFPVLVRLNPSTFSGFAKTQPGGADIRFAKSNGDHLPYEIERWSDGPSDADTAVIWVLVDTVRGNDSTQFFRMYWGKSDAVGQSNPRAVFDTANGFLGVWHLNTPGTDPRPDATYNSYNADVYNATFANNGAIAGCDTFAYESKQYDSVASGINLVDKSFSIAAWFKLKDSVPTEFLSILGQGKGAVDSGLHFGYRNATPPPAVGKLTFAFWGDDLDSKSAYSGGTAWHLLVGTYNASNKTQTLYYDGVSNNFRTAKNNYRGSGAFRIGTGCYITNYFNGRLDEVRVEKTVRSADWIKLCYATQKQSSPCVTIQQQTPPSFTKHPTDTTVIAGTAARMTVTVSGASPFTFAWYKSSVAAGAIVSGQTATILAFSNVQKSDSGSYLCVARNDYGADTSDPGKLTVLGAKPDITTQPKDTSVLLNHSWSMFVKATGETPLSYSWYKSGSATKIGSDSVYKDSSAHMSDTGSYFCIVSNVNGSDTSTPGKLTIAGAEPVVTVQPKDTSVLENHAWSMSVTVTGNPPPSYSWYKSGSVVKIGSDSVYKDSSAQMNDTGSYYCIAANAFAACTSKAAKLTVVHDPANVIGNPISLRGFSPDSDQVRLTISGYKGLPMSASAWYADSVLIWYRTGSFPQTPSLSAVPAPVALPLSAMTADTFATTLTVKAIGTGNYYFKASVHWRNPAATPPDSIPPFGNDATGAIIAMGDTSRLANPLRMTFAYNPPDSLVKVTIDSLKSPRLRWNLITGANLLYALPGNPFTAKPLTKDQLQHGKDTCIVTVSDPRFSGEEKTVRWMLLLTGKYNNVSDTVNDSCKTGAPRPENTIVVNPPDSVWATRVKLSWRRSPAQAIDSIRIWYGTKKEVPNDSVSPPDFSPITVRGTDSTAMIGQLKDSTLYYFGLQAQRHNLWSKIRDSSRTSARTTTMDSSVKPIKNSLVLIGAPLFDSLANKLKFTWKIADTGYLMLYAGIVWQKDSGAFPEPSAQPPVGKIITITDPSKPMTVSFDVDGISIQFDTKYYFGIFLKTLDGKWSQPTDSSKGTFIIPKPLIFPITYFGDSIKVQAFGGKVILKKIGEFSSVVNAKIKLIKIPPLLSGLIPVSDVFKFEQVAPPTPIGFGLRYDSIPVPFKLRDIRMYHFDDVVQKWFVDTIPERDSVARVVSIRISASNLTRPFMLAIDTIRPKITVHGDTSSALQQDGSDIAVNGRVEDNIANPEVILSAGRGDDSLLFKKTISPPDSIDCAIPCGYVQGDCGMRILIAVNDGRFADTANISRDIRLSGADDFTPDKERWMPVGTTMKPDSASVDKVLNEYSPGGGAQWQYDTKKLRLFRWSQGDWLEYSAQVHDRFSFIPGRLIWLKTRKTDIIRFDSGRTVSLKRPYTISLHSKDWTDFILPFRFEIHIGDVLSANDTAAANSLQFYVWNKNQAGLSTLNGLYLPSNPSFNNKKTKLSYLKNDDRAAYSVYNPLDKDVELRIPPVPVALSPLQAERKPKTTAAAGWSIAVRPYLRDNEELSPVFCAYDAEGGVSASYPLPPSWSTVNVGITDANRTGVYGNIVTGELKNDGYAYQLVFMNSEAAATTIFYTVERYAGTALSIGVLDPQSGVVSTIDSTLHVTVEANSREYRWLAIGSPQYIEGLCHELAKGEFALVRLAPNPFRGMLRIGYKVPYAGIASVRCELIDQLGRVVWSAGGNRNVRPGVNEFVYPRKRILAAGAYIVRLTGFDTNGKKKEERLSRVMYVP